MFDIESLKAMKRPGLQKLAKEHGLKANGKNVDIIARLEEFYHAQSKEQEVQHESPSAADTPQSQGSFAPLEPQQCPNPESIADAIVANVPESTPNVSAISISSSPFLSSPRKTRSSPAVTPRHSVLTSASKDGMKKRFSKLEEQRQSLTPRASRTPRRSEIAVAVATTPAQQDVLKEVNARVASFKKKRSSKAAEQIKARSQDLRRKAMEKRSSKASAAASPRTGVKASKTKRVSVTSRFNAVHQKQFSKLKSVDSTVTHTASRIGSGSGNGNGKKAPTVPSSKLPRVAQLTQAQAKRQNGSQNQSQNKDPNHQKPKTFDLKASLAKKPSWSMKKGKVPAPPAPEKKERRVSVKTASKGMGKIASVSAVRAGASVGRKKVIEQRRFVVSKA